MLHLLKVQYQGGRGGNGCYCCSELSGVMTEEDWRLQRASLNI